MGDWTVKTEDANHLLQTDTKAEQTDGEAHCKLECKDFTISGVCSLTSGSVPPVTEEAFAGNDIGSTEVTYVHVKTEDPDDQTPDGLEYILVNQVSGSPTPAPYEEPEQYYGSTNSEDRAVSIMAPLSAAERQRRYRARRDADPERRQKYLETERQRWRRDVEQGKKKKISDLSELGKVQQRNKWKEQNMKRKEMAEARKHRLDTPLILSNGQCSSQDLQVQKRTADKLVTEGRSIPDAHELYEALAETSTTVKLFYVASEAVEQAMEARPGQIPPVPSTLKTHQVVTFTPGELLYRQVSCMCSMQKQLRCQCFTTQHF